MLRSGAGLKPVQGRAPGLSQLGPIAPCAVGPIESRSKGGSNHPNHSRSRHSFRLAVTSRKPAGFSLLARPFRAGQSDFRCYRASFVCAPNTRISCETPGARMRTRRHLSGTPWRREGVSSASSGCSAAPLTPPLRSIRRPHGEFVSARVRKMKASPAREAEGLLDDSASCGSYGPHIAFAWLGNATVFPNWTQGCVGLGTWGQIERVATWVQRTGTTQIVLR